MIKDKRVQFSDLVVIEEIPIQVRLGDDVSICRQDSIILNLKFNDGKAPYTYNWSTSETSEKLKFPTDIIWWKLQIQIIVWRKTISIF